MTNKQLAPKVRAWLKSTDADPEDVRRSVGMLSGRVQQVRQRGRWWPLPSLGHKETPAPPTNHFSHTGRTHAMFSPTKAVAAGALIFALGGMLAIAQPFGRQSGTLPGAETEAIAPTWVTGSIRHVEDSCSRTDVTFEGGVTRSRYLCTETWTSTDPRLTGDVSFRWNEDAYQADEGVFSVSTDAAYLRHEAGDWACSASSIAKGATPTREAVIEAGVVVTYTCVGSGGYEGLSAVLVLEENVDFGAEFVGLIFSGDLPPLPEPPPAE